MQPLTSSSPRVLARLSATFLSETDPSAGVCQRMGMMRADKDPSEYSVRVSRTSARRWLVETAFCDYAYARLHALNLMAFIRESGGTDGHSRFNVDLSMLDGRRNVTGSLDPLKIVLGFDEGIVESHFPGRIGGGFTQSIKVIRSEQTIQPRADMRSYFVTEGSERAIDFTKLALGYLRVKYIGGRGYEQRPAAALAVMEAVATAAVKGVVQPGAYNEVEKAEFSRIINESTRRRMRCKDQTSFREAYPKLTLTADMNPNAVEGMYPRMQEKILSLLEGCDVDGDEPALNYDPERGMLQLKDAVVRARTLSFVDLVNCKVLGGRLHRCQMFESSCEGSLLSACYASQTSVKDSTIVDSYLASECVVESSILDGGASEVRCELRGCVMRNGLLTAQAVLNDTEVFQKVKRDDAQRVH